MYLATVERYDTLANTWAPVAIMNVARYALAAAVLDGYIYAIGGENSPTSIFSSVEIYNGNSWAIMNTSMAIPRSFLGATTLNGSIYAVGGTANIAGTITTLQSMERYDPWTNRWTNVSDMTTRRSSVAVIALNARIYAIGGSDGAGQALSSVECYDPSVNAWSSVASLNTARYALTAALSKVAEGWFIFAFGGRNGDTLLTSVECYDPVNNEWTYVGTSLPSGQYEMASVSANGLIYTMGGFSGAYLSSAEYYDPAANSWTGARSLQTARCGLAAVVL